MSLKVGLALGGGASRGLAHLGVIKALNESGIPIDIITGVSIGGIIGSIYASHPDIDHATDSVRSFIASDAFNQTKLDFIKASKEQSKGYYQQFKRLISTGFYFAVSTTRSSFISQHTFQNNLNHLISKINIEDCPVPLGLVATNLESGQMKSFTSGPMMDAVLASAAIPGVFPPIKVGEDSYVDGSWVNPIPVELAFEMGADFVIAVDVAPALSNDAPYSDDLTGWDIQLRAGEASRLAIKQHKVEKSDAQIVVNLMDIHWADFSQLDLCVERGYSETLAAMETIRMKLAKKKFRRFFWLS